MRRAYRFAAAGALRHLVHTHRLVGPALAMPQAGLAHTTAALRRVRVGPLRVPVADDPAAAGARREASRAGRMPILGADPLVRRAVLQPARRADAHVLLPRRLTAPPTLGDALRFAEVLGAARA